ncbi:GNAT family N-acetyltransferase [Agathobaculum desmolans]|uniref:GNAT family N-acetyltransferase n=1 Tax=Agathobaculum desmolans TaxID=39484 RepID=UPI00248DFA9A|nr:GNAT family N-acetyltransferase [Agathobaculum desmolans]
MQIEIRPYVERDAAQAAAVWNEVVEEGDAFPQTERLTAESGAAFFTSQSFTGVACDAESGQIVGVYILHPNNVGRCGHICNASYAVASDRRGQHIGEQLVCHCMKQAAALGFRVLQFNAVVCSNAAALALYRKLGFVQLGVIPGGFRRKDGSYEDIIPHYHVL